MDRRAAAEENYRKKFEEFGLSERFTFLRREWSACRDRRFWSRCKTCGAEFISYPEVFRGRQKHLLCPQCGTASDGENVWSRSLQCDQAMEFYQQGHSASETAARFCVTISQVNAVVKARGITNGRDWREAAADSNRRRHDDAVVRHEVIKKAREAEKQREAAKKATQKEEQRRQVELIRTEKRKAREQARQRAEAEKAEALFHSLNDKIHVCTVCGCNFSIAEFMKSKELKLVPTAPKYCSAECERKHYNRLTKNAKKRSRTLDHGNHRHRARKYGVAYEPGITLKKVFKRDNGICQICGKPCDWSDRGWSKYCGPLYPSIDHIIALANGGGHVWSNVQLAHMMCNSEKCYSIEKVV